MNYRGSTGFGQDSILSLPGNVGHQDVKDVQVAGCWAPRQGGWSPGLQLAVGELWHPAHTLVRSAAGAPGGTL